MTIELTAEEITKAVGDYVLDRIKQESVSYLVKVTYKASRSCLIGATVEITINGPSNAVGK